MSWLHDEMASMDLKMPETHFDIYDFSLTDKSKAKKTKKGVKKILNTTHSISCSNKEKAALAFNGNWVSMYDPIKIDPYLLLKEKQKKFLQFRMKKLCFLLLFYSILYNLLFFIFSTVFFRFHLQNRRKFWCCILASIHIKWTKILVLYTYIWKLYFPSNSV